jgi:hypothetical protein
MPLSSCPGCRSLTMISLIPIMFFTFMLNFMDKTTLNSSAILGIIQDIVCPLFLARPKAHQTSWVETSGAGLFLGFEW